jgi:hypothetical protein
MLTIQTKYKFGIAAVSVMMLFTGCTPQPQAPVYDDNGVCTALPKEKVYINKGGYSTLESYTVYTPDVDLKLAVVILMKKVDRLEQKVSELRHSSCTSKMPKVSYKGCGPAEPVKKKFKKFKDGLYLAYKKVPIWSCATKRGEKVGWITKKRKVRLSHCGIYGWCKLEGQRGYVEAWKLKRIGD